MLDTHAYLARIAYAGPTSPTKSTLCALHRAHMLAVPFENLDIDLDRQIVCQESAFWRKIVTQRRGGFCYELNGAFAALLRELGFKVTLLSARVPRADGSDGPEFDHLTLLVDLDEPWLADVGFGDSFLTPLRLQSGIEQLQGHRKFRITEESGDLDLEMAEANKNWRRQYSFTLQARRLADFAGMCHYHQTSPESHFTRQRICSMATPGGRITLTDMKLIVTRNGKREEKLLASDEEYWTVLNKMFGIAIRP